MSYRSYIGASTTQGLTNATWSFPQTLMLYDIAALQYMYGANYNTNSGNTVYKWNPSTGQETINGVAQAAPGGNTIFMTLWDGGGNDTYDFSNYTTNLNVNLQPGGWTTTSAAQLANLGAGHTAIGNIANAYLYNNNPASLIENAIGGSGNDVITGNAANNKLTGGAGNDTLDGVSGTDTAVYSGPSSSYQVTQNADGSWKVVDLRTGSPDGTDTLKNIDFLQFSNTTVAIGTVQPPPPPPVVSVPVISAVTPDTANPTDGITNAKVLTLAGTAQANATVKVYDGTMLLGSTVAGSNGSWNYTTSTLTDGNHSFTATATDASGNTSLASGATNVIVDTTPPVTPTIALQSVDSGVAGDNITNVKVVSLTGVAEINSTITIKDGATVLGSAVANAEGVWKLVLDMTDDQIAGLAGVGLGDQSRRRRGNRHKPDAELGVHHRVAGRWRSQFHGDLDRCRRQCQCGRDDERHDRHGRAERAGDHRQQHRQHQSGAADRHRGGGEHRQAVRWIDGARDGDRECERGLELHHRGAVGRNAYLHGDGERRCG